MQRASKLIGSLLAAGICLSPMAITALVAQPSLAQTQGETGETLLKEIEQLVQQATQYEQQGKPLQAIEIWQQLLAVAQQVKIRQLEAAMLNNIGFVYSRIGQLQQALNYYNQALPIMREVNNRRGEVTTLNSIGALYNSIGQSQQALDYYNQALPILQEVNDRRGEATTLNNIGGVYDSIGQPQEALNYYNQALPIMREVNDRGGEATMLNNVGFVYHSIGQPQEALNYYNQALPIMREVNDRGGEATMLSNIGLVYHSIGQAQQALNYYNQALPIRREINDRRGEATTLNNIGGVYDSIGQPQQALNYYNQALPIRREINDRRGEATTLNNIGGVYDSIGQPQQAFNYYTQALPILREVNDRRMEATTLNNIGAVYSSIGQPQQALNYYTQALPILREVNDRRGEATTLNNIGEVYSSIGQPQQVLNYFNQALPIRREVNDRSGEATTLSNIGAIYSSIGQPQQAIARWQESVEITLEMRGSLLQENRKQFLETNRGTSIALADLLIDQNQPEKAFEWINRVTTFELAEFSRLIDARVSNPEAQKLIDEWNQKIQQLNALRQQAANNDYPVALQQRIIDLEAEIRRKAEEIARRFPEVAELFETTPTDINILRANIPAGTVVIQPVLLTNISNVPNTVALFVLTKDELKVIKHAIEPESFDQLVTAHYEALTGLGEDTITGIQLYDILIRPIESQIQALSPKNISIIATGKLRYIPFETFYDSQTEQYLIEKYPINYLTRISAHSLQETRNSSPSQRRVLGLGNPVPRDPQNLLGSEEEVKSITALLPGSASYLNSEATLDRFKLQASRFPILHLATHGCFNPEGCPKLNMKPNTILFADTQFNIADAALLGLQDTRLITLSACQTALNTNSDGREISGVAYIFERAGASAVMATLWSVEDLATRDLMVQFYQKLNTDNMSTSEALRQAKISQIKNNLHPYYWSGFVLIGDGR